MKRRAMLVVLLLAGGCSYSGTSIWTADVGHYRDGTCRILEWGGNFRSGGAHGSPYSTAWWSATVASVVEDGGARLRLQPVPRCGSHGRVRPEYHGGFVWTVVFEDDVWTIRERH